MADEKKTAAPPPEVPIPDWAADVFVRFVQEIIDAEYDKGSLDPMLEHYVTPGVRKRGEPPSE